jgi:RNA polymerase sigma-70 factor (ECF subfamily)
MHTTDRERLFVEQLEALRRFVRLLVRDEDAADELVQDVAVTVFAHADGPLDAASFPLWCRGVARHLSMHRRRAFARLTACLDALESAPERVGSDLERAMIARDELSAGLDVLDEAAQLLLIARFIGGETSTELGARLHLSPASIRMRLARARSAMRSAARSDDEKKTVTELTEDADDDA